MKMGVAALMFAVLMLGAGPTAARAGDEEPAGKAAAEQDPELRAEVPALTAMHEVIYPLWHTAWAEKNTAMMKDLLPQVREHVEAVEKADLPGILRDKKPEWTKGVKDLRSDLKAYEKAAAADDAPALADAVEALHGHFEDLMRLVHPVMDELDAYHVELYKIVHRYLPEKQLQPLQEAAAAMAVRCDALNEAPVPKWFADRADTLKVETHVLCTKTRALGVAAPGGDWTVIENLVDQVHAQYQKVERLFD